MSTTTETRKKLLPYLLPATLNGTRVERLEDYDPEGNYLHILTANSPKMDDAILNGARVIAKCGVRWRPKATDFPAPGAAVTNPWCPVCVLIHGYHGWEGR